MNRSRLRREYSGRRALSLLAAVVCIVAQLAGAAHFALVPHSVCAEHGELVHGAAHSASTAAARADGASGAVIRSAGDSDADHGHDHCTVTSHRVDARHVERVVIAVTEPRAAIEPTAVLEPNCTPVPVPRALLLLMAPKSSPPLRRS